MSEEQEALKRVKETVARAAMRGINQFSGGRALVCADDPRTVQVTVDMGDVFGVRVFEFSVRELYAS